MLELTVHLNKTNHVKISHIVPFYIGPGSHPLQSTKPLSSSFLFSLLVLAEPSHVQLGLSFPPPTPKLCVPSPIQTAKQILEHVAWGKKNIPET